ncbi:MAG: hypothetical protein KGL59_09225 [Acidobacteriota bacterium]|nr:hypothetical protein [Acidobacteriota bacterium]
MTRKTESGQALVLTAVALVALLGVMGLAIDMGVLRYDKRLQQTAADAAAVAGAANLPYDGAGSSGVTTAARVASAQNGFTDGSSATCGAPPTNLALYAVQVTVCNPPIDGPHTGDSNYVESYVSEGQPTFFMKVMGVSTKTVTARAVATDKGGDVSGGCLITLGPPQASIEGVNINGSATLNAPNCGIEDNGDFNTKGNKLIVNAQSFGVSGGWNSSGPGGTVTCSGSTANCPATGAGAAFDPLTTYKTNSPCTDGTYTCTECPLGYNCTVSDPAITINGGSTCGTGCTYDSTTSTYTIVPGIYSSITITGAGSTPNVVFEPGVYVVDGSGLCSSSGAACFNETGNANISTGTGTANGGGLTFYFINNSTVNITGTPTLTLIAPSSGTYQGLLMFQAPSDCSTYQPCDVNTGGPNQTQAVSSDAGPALGGNSGSNYEGALYFPDDQVTFFGNSTGTASSGYSVATVVSYSFAMSGNPYVNLTGPGGMPGGQGILHTAILVE